MLHLLLYGLLAIALAAGLFALAARFLPAGEQIAPPLRDEPPWELPPDRPLLPDDVDGVRLPVALRGYRFAETDLLLDRLAGELRARDEEIARLRGGPGLANDITAGGDGPDPLPAAVAPEPVAEPVSAAASAPETAAPETAAPETGAPETATPGPGTAEARHAAPDVEQTGGDGRV